MRARSTFDCGDRSQSISHAAPIQSNRQTQLGGIRGLVQCGEVVAAGRKRREGLRRYSGVRRWAMFAERLGRLNHTSRIKANTMPAPIKIRWRKLKNRSPISMKIFCIRGQNGRHYGDANPYVFFIRTIRPGGLTRCPNQDFHTTTGGNLRERFRGLDPGLATRLASDLLETGADHHLGAISAHFSTGSTGFATCDLHLTYG